MAVGGLAISSSFAHGVQVDVEAVNYAHKVTSEIKWSKAKPLRYAAYLAYIDLLFELIEANLVHVHIRFQKMIDYNHNLGGERKRTDTISKAHYQLMLHRAVRYYGGESRIHIRPDNGVCTELLPSFVDRLNQEARRKFQYPDNCVWTVEPRDSAKEPLLQLLDVILGALTAYRNERHLDPKTSEHKKQLAIYAFNKTGLPDLQTSTPINNGKFSIWNVTPIYTEERAHRG